MNIRKNIPNTITCLNLLCGCMGIVCAFQENGGILYSSVFIGLAAIFDFLDGFVARLLKAHSEIGKQLDSLADMVTFGVLPGVMMFKLIDEAFTQFHQDSMHLQYIGFLITVFSAIRLAKFNIDTRQTDSFIGLPTPANSILIASFPLIILQTFELLPNRNTTLVHLSIANPYFLIGLTVVMSYLLVAELPLFALKFKNFGWTDNKIRYIFLGLSLVMLIAFEFVAVPFIIALYILLSVVNNFSQKTA